MDLLDQRVDSCRHGTGDAGPMARDEQLARTIEASLDALVVTGNGVSLETLKRAGIKKADLVLAVTQVDEVNLIACMTASKAEKYTSSASRARSSFHHRFSSTSVKVRGGGPGGVKPRAKVE